MTLAFEYLPRIDSWMGQRDPRWKLATLVVAAAVSTVLQTATTAVPALAGSLLLVACSRLPLRWYIGRLAMVLIVLAPFLLFLPLVGTNDDPAWQLGPLRWSYRGLAVAWVLGCKALTITTLILILLATTPLHVLFQAAQALHIPRLFVQLGLLTYRYLFVLAEEFARLRVALRVRGFRNRATLHAYRTVGHVTGTLLVRGHERAGRVSQAMRCRGFDGRFRTLTTFETTWADLTMFVLIGSAAVGLLVWDLLQR